MEIPSELRFILYVAGLYVSFIYWGFLQEKITSTVYNSATQEDFKWNYPFALNFFMALGGYLAAVLAELLTGGNKNKSNTVSVLNFWKPSLSCAIGSPLGYASLKYISFPLMLLAKSSKPVPLMLIGVLYYKKSYPWYKYVSVLMVCSGIALFSSVKKPGSVEVQESFDLYKQLFGIFLIGLNLFLDGYTNNAQDEIFERDKATPMEMMKYTNIWQVLVILTYLVGMFVIQGEASELHLAYTMILACPQISWDIMLFCLCAASGQILIFAVMQEFGSLAWITISITRKLFTILFSIFMFNHKIKSVQWMGIACVFVGLILESAMTLISKHSSTKTVADSNQKSLKKD